MEEEGLWRRSRTLQSMNWLGGGDKRSMDMGGESGNGWGGWQRRCLSPYLKVMGANAYNIEHIWMVDVIPDSSVPIAMTEINAV
ncbi:unnamed protein product [Ilex paraguariensis]|uniref:Uncharacterized protein n=1 Tax=Ilex paraguariensis TaxID=185542 RepID=A0ABC8V1X1_9AQUA